MRIGIDVSWALGPPSGTATYTRGLVDALVRRAPQHEFVLFTRGPALSQSARGTPACQESAPGKPASGVSTPGQPAPGQPPGAGAANARHVRVDAPLTNLRQHVTLPLALRRAGLDLYHSPAFFLPPIWRGPSVVSMFDVNFLRLRESWQPGRRRAYLSLALQAPLAAHQATRLITLSQTSARDLSRLLRVAPDKIAVIPAAPRGIFFAPPDPAQAARARERYGAFVLSVGVLAPQKNLERVLRAFAAAARGDIRLVLAGQAAGDYADAVLRPLARELGIAERVTFAGPTDDEELRALYDAALCLLYPSLGEGFGLPIVEAMARGCPVITSSISSMPEVAGDAALLVQPRDGTQIADALDRLLASDALRADLAARGRYRAAAFTWDAAADQTLRCYDEAVQAARAARSR